MRTAHRCLSAAFLCLLFSTESQAWGFFGHKMINRYAVYLLPPEMLLFYKRHQQFLEEHAVDPDKRRYLIKEEGARHYIDIDRYGAYPYDSLPRKYKDAEAKFSADSLQAHGIVPWHILTMMTRLTKAFEEKNFAGILKNSADIGHYIADSHVPLHTSSNHNGQHTNQHGIHGFWESRVPELLAAGEWDFFLESARYIKKPSEYIWSRVLESAAAADSVLRIERELTESFPADGKYAFEFRAGKTIRQYSEAFCRAYDKRLRGMIEQRMRQSIFSVAAIWYTCWVNAGQPSLDEIAKQRFSASELNDFKKMEMQWLQKSRMLGREE